MVLVIGENIKARCFARFSDGISVSYVHAGGKIGVLVNLESDLSAEKVEEIGKDVPCISPGPAETGFPIFSTASRSASSRLSAAKAPRCFSKCWRSSGITTRRARSHRICSPAVSS